MNGHLKLYCPLRLSQEVGEKACELFQGCTSYKATGWWEGKAEPVDVVEVYFTRLPSGYGKVSKLVRFFTAYLLGEGEEAAFFVLNGEAKCVTSEE